MKYLIICLIISACGKHQQPESLDFRDTDGDDIINYYDHNKLVSDQDEKVQIYGTISFDKGNQIKEFHSFDITNDLDFKETTKTMLTRHIAAAVFWKYTSPYIVLNIKSAQALNFDNEIYYIDVDLNASEGQFSSLILLESKKTTLLEKWAPRTTIKLDKPQLTALLRGDAHLAIERNSQQRLRLDQQFQKTYPIFLLDKNKSQLLRVSNELTITDFMKSMSIDRYNVFDSNNIFYKNLDDKKSWWLRSTKEYHVVAFLSEEEVYDSFLQGFEIRNYKISRKDGISNNVTIKKHKDAKIILNIKGTKLDNVFSNRKSVQITKVGSASIKCDLTYIDAIKTKVSLVSSDLASNLDLYTNSENINNQVRFSTIGESTVLKLTTPNTVLDLSLKNLPSSSFRKVGTVWSNCTDFIKTQLVSQEHHLSLEVEALVEKIPE